MIDGVLHEVRKHGLGSGHWSLEREGVVIASAQKISAVKRSFALQTAIGPLSLMSYGAFTRRFFVGKGNDVLASISPTSVFSRKAVIEVQDDALDFPLSVFACWLVVLLWRRRRSSG